MTHYTNTDNPIDFPDMEKAAEDMSDKGYEESTHEKQAEFARNRNYEWDNWKPIKDIQ